MTTAAMREQLIAYLSAADDKKIEGLYSLLEDNIKDAASVTLTAEQLDFLNKEREMHLKGESKSYSWEEARELIRKKKAS